MTPAQKLRALFESKGIYKQAIALMREHTESRKATELGTGNNLYEIEAKKGETYKLFHVSADTREDARALVKKQGYNAITCNMIG